MQIFKMSEIEFESYEPSKRLTLDKSRARKTPNPKKTKLFVKFLD